MPKPFTGILVKPTQTHKAGVQVLNITLYNAGNVVQQYQGWSGVPAQQQQSQATRYGTRGTAAPLPDGVFTVGNFSQKAAATDGMGPWQAPLTEPGLPVGHMGARRGIALHPEWNQIPGSHGCLSVFDTPTLQADMAAYFAQHGTVPIIVDILPGSQGPGNEAEAAQQVIQPPKPDTQPTKPNRPNTTPQAPVNPTPKPPKTIPAPVNPTTPKPPTLVKPPKPVPTPSQPPIAEPNPPKPGQFVVPDMPYWGE
jgi:hypothetical protein